jgi:hypothetical protein
MRLIGRSTRADLVYHRRVTSKAWLALVALLWTGAGCSPLDEGLRSRSGGSSGSGAAGSETAAAEVAPEDSRTPPSASPSEWLRIEHDDFPISFEVPDGTEWQRENVFSLGRPRRDDRSHIDAVMYGVRTLEEQHAAYHAVQFAFFWVTDDVLGVDSASLLALRQNAADPRAIARFLNDVFYSRRDVSLIDLGRDAIDGHPARRTAIVWRVARGTPHERTIEGEALVIPVSDHEVLVAIVRFDSEATSRERAEIFPRVARSLRIGITGIGPLEARSLPGSGGRSPPAGLRSASRA